MSDNRMRIAYVHDSPLHESLATDYRNPVQLSNLGFTDVVISDQMSGCLYSTTPDLIERIDSAINAGIFTIQLRQSTPPPPFAETANLVVDSFPEFMQLAKLKAIN